MIEMCLWELLCGRRGRSHTGLCGRQIVKPTVGAEVWRSCWSVSDEAIWAGGPELSLGTEQPVWFYEFISEGVLNIGWAR